jgi:hypothetical protein
MTKLLGSPAAALDTIYLEVTATGYSEFDDVTGRTYREGRVKFYTINHTNQVDGAEFASTKVRIVSLTETF